MAPEHALLARARDGDESAFRALVEPHRARLWSICLRVAGNRQDAEDALQDALTATWMNLAAFRGESRFSTWAYRIAANAAVAVIRRRREVPVEGVADLAAGATPDHADTVATRDQVTAVLATLPAPMREALVLREYADLSYEEIARHQGVPVQTVKSRLNRARAAFAAAWSQ